jgi:SPP1 family phage portal protein
LDVTENLINQCLAELRSNRAKFSIYKRYFNGEHDIIENYAMQDARSNMKVVCNFPKRFIEEEISYTLANPVNYISVEDDYELINIIDLNFSCWEKVHDMEILKQALIYGHAFELNYTNLDGEFKAGVYTPMDMVVIEDDTAERKVILAVHLFTKNRFDSTEYVDVYFDDKIVHYKIDDGLKKIEEDTHIFSGVPITVCRANMELHSLIDDIKSLNDGYNSVLSDAINECSDLRNCFMVITGAELEKDDVGKLKQEGIIQVPKDASVQFLLKNLSDNYIQNLLKTIEKKIFQMAAHLDHNEAMQPNTSSLSLRSRLINLENKCSLLQAMIELVIKQRLKRFFQYLKIKTGEEYDYRTIRLKFTSNVPTDLQSISQVITQLQNTISQESALSLLPFVESPKLELEKFRKEKENSTIDLDQVDDYEQ